MMMKKTKELNELINNISKNKKLDEETTIQSDFYYLMFSNDTKTATSKISNYIIKKYNLFTIKNDIRTEIYFYKNGIYENNGKCELKEIIKRLIDDYFNPNIISTILSKIEAETFITIEEFINKINNPNQIHLIPVQNGIYNINKKILIDFSPNYVFINKLPIFYDINANCPKIEKFLLEILDNKENVELLYEITGFCLYREYFIEKAIIFDGSGRNGKSKILSLIQKLIGEKNFTSVPLSQLNENSFSVSELFGKLLNSSGDISNEEIKETATFKKTVGRDSINGKRKFLTDLNFTNYAKHIFSLNELPKIYDATDGFWDKWVLIQFKNQFKEEKEYNSINEEERKNRNWKLANPNILKEITTEQELNGFFLKAIEGLERIQKNKEFSYNETSEKIKEYWNAKSDSFHLFCNKYLESGELTDFISKALLRRFFHKFCLDKKVKGCSDKAIHVRLQEEFGVSDSRDRYGEHIWKGLKLKADNHDNLIKEFIKELIEYKKTIILEIQSPN
jgi:putative DNA primase/helicase